MIDTINHGLNEEQLREIRQWHKFQTRLKKFRIKNNIDTFNELFGKEHGERLLRHFRSDCNEDTVKFETYLTSHQKDQFFIYVINIPL